MCVCVCKSFYRDQQRKPVRIKFRVKRWRKSPDSGSRELPVKSERVNMTVGGGGVGG